MEGFTKYGGPRTVAESKVRLGETLIETSGAALTNWSPVGNFALSQL